MDKYLLLINLIRKEFYDRLQLSSGHRRNRIILAFELSLIEALSKATVPKSIDTEPPWKTPIPETNSTI